ncbi:MAG: GNAT family N-acetyltransferase [Nocardioidaceae bacterium]
MSADLDAVEIRRAGADEVDVIADVFWASRHANAATIPLLVHPLDDVRRWVREQLLDRHEVWVAETGGVVVGFMALGQPDWIEHLYLRPDASGHGLGSRFVDLAKRELLGQIQLWTFQSNLGARRFYGRHGFVEVEWTDGDNQEGAPDVRFLYSP